MVTPSKSSHLLILSLLSFLTLSHSYCSPQDSNTLLQIKTHFNNASTFADWVPDTDCCTWHGIGCNDHCHPDRVTFLYLGDAYDVVVGEIPPIIGDLTYLTSLTIRGFPNVSGPIPPTIANLTNLEELYLAFNNLSGPIPDFFDRRFKSLTTLDLSANSFSGPIPSSLAQLPSILELKLSLNKLTGSIPKSFASIKTNLALKLYYNLLSGPIPRSIGRANFSLLHLMGNQFTGDASFLFGRDKALSTIILSNNKFKFDFSNVEVPLGLVYLDISHNQIYGSLPKGLGQLPPLSIVIVSYNELCGPIPGPRLNESRPAYFVQNKCLCGPPLTISCKK